MSPAFEHARSHLADLREEHLAAVAAGLADHPAYRADLQEEMAWAKEAYVAAAVTEVASFRGQLTGIQQG